jgi:23S rRNA maturation mini-RNase III
LPGAAVSQFKNEITHYSKKAVKVVKQKEQTKHAKNLQNPPSEMDLLNF